MKTIFAFLTLFFLCLCSFSQKTNLSVQEKDVQISSAVEFFMYEGPYGQHEKINEPAIKFTLNVKNIGKSEIPDLCVSNRSQYVNFYIDDKKNNPLSMYNGIETIGDHMLGYGETDTYTWWIFVEDAYAKEFTVQWEYCNIFSNKHRVNIDSKKVQVVK